MPRNRKPGYAGIALLKALESGNRYGLDLMAATDLPSGTVYPQLGRLEARGLVRAEWEAEEVARREARPDSPTSTRNGSPITTWTFFGYTNFACRGITSAEPPMPTGTIGTPARAAT